MVLISWFRWVRMQGNECPLFSREVSKLARFDLAQCQTLARSLLSQEILLKTPRCHEICSLCCITARLEFDRRLSQDLLALSWHDCRVLLLQVRWTFPISLQVRWTFPMGSRDSVLLFAGVETYVLSNAFSHSYFCQDLFATHAFFFTRMCHETQPKLLCQLKMLQTWTHEHKHILYSQRVASLR